MNLILLFRAYFAAEKKLVTDSSWFLRGKKQSRKDSAQVFFSFLGPV